MILSLKNSLISEAVGLSFHGFDFIVGALQRAG